MRHFKGVLDRAQVGESDTSVNTLSAAISCFCCVNVVVSIHIVFRTHRFSKLSCGDST